MKAYIDDEKLIAAVKKRPLIYDIDDPQHNNRSVLINSWIEIAQELGHEVHSVKERWIYMRDYYRKKVRELKLIKAGALSKRFKKWSMYDQLGFLMPHLRDLDFKRPRRLTATPQRPESDVDSEEEGVQIGLVKTEKADKEDEDENHSDDSYCRDVVQALDVGFSSMELPAPLNKSATKANAAVGKQRAEQPTPEDGRRFKRNGGSVAKRKCLEATPALLADPSPVVAREDPAEDNDSNRLFFRSLMPLIETLDPLEAMEFRYEVHGVLLRFLREAREKQRGESPRQAPSSNQAKVRDRGDAAEDTYVISCASDNCLGQVQHNSAQHGDADASHS